LPRKAYFLEEIQGLFKRMVDKAIAKGQGAQVRRLGQVLIVGNEKTSDDTILKAIQLSPGQIFTETDLWKAEQFLKRCYQIEAVTVKVVESRGELQDVLVTVKEK
jgi:outer membrane protein assembly factor BamA